MGIVDSKEGGQSIGVRFYLNLEAQAGIEAQEKRIRQMDASLVQDSPWWLCSLGSLSTIIREWVALQHVHCLPFRDVLLQGKPRARKADRRMELAQAMEKRVKQEYNASQVDALRAGLDGTPVVLIQGPPGTGKTHAILGLLSIILHSTRRETLELMEETVDKDIAIDRTPEMRTDLWMKLAPWIAGQKCKRWTTAPRIV